MTFNGMDDTPNWLDITASWGDALPGTRLVTHVTYDDRLIPPFFYISFANSADRDALWRNPSGGDSRSWHRIQNAALPPTSGIGSLSLNPYDSAVLYAVTLNPVAGYVSVHWGVTWHASFPD
jgi:hypothetical protein